MGKNNSLIVRDFALLDFNKKIKSKLLEVHPQLDKAEVDRIIDKMDFSSFSSDDVIAENLNKLAFELKFKEDSFKLERISMGIKINF